MKCRTIHNAASVDFLQIYAKKWGKCTNEYGRIPYADSPAVRSNHCAFGLAPQVCIEVQNLLSTSIMTTSTFVVTSMVYYSLYRGIDHALGWNDPPEYREYFR